MVRYDALVRREESREGAPKGNITERDQELATNREKVTASARKWSLRFPGNGAENTENGGSSDWVRIIVNRRRRGDVHVSQLDRGRGGGEDSGKGGKRNPALKCRRRWFGASGKDSSFRPPRQRKRWSLPEGRGVEEYGKVCKGGCGRSL